MDMAWLLAAAAFFSVSGLLIRLLAGLHWEE
jgi:hypothetical protein